MKGRTRNDEWFNSWSTGRGWEERVTACNLQFVCGVSFTNELIPARDSIFGLTSGQLFKGSFQTA